MTPSVPEQLRLLAKELRTLIGCIEELRPGPKRDALASDIARCLDQLQLMIGRQGDPLH